MTEKPFADFYLRNGKPDSWCKQCYRASQKAWRQTDAAKDCLRQYRSTDAYKQKKAEADRAYRDAQGEALRAKKRAYHEANKQAHAEKMAQNYAQNKDAYKARVAKWKTENREKWNARCMERHAAKLRACPSWLSTDEKWLIEQAYELAQKREQVCGGKWHVDHIVPLRGKTVSGLHVPWNLQVIPASVNCSKRNAWK